MSEQPDIMEELQAELREKTKQLQQLEKEKDEIMREQEKYLLPHLSSHSLHWDLTKHLECATESLKELFLLHHDNNHDIALWEKTILSSKHLEESLLYTNQETRDLFCSLIDAKHTFVTFSLFGTILPLVHNGLVYLCQGREGIVAIVPTQVAEAFAHYAPNLTKEKIARITLLYQYGVATINLYGAIHVDALVDIFNEQNPEPTTAEECNRVLNLYQCPTCYGILLPPYFMAEHLAFEENDDLQTLLKEQEGKKRYIPNKEELLRYADEYYIRPFAEYKALRDFFLTLSEDTDTVDELLLDITSSILFHQDIRIIVRTIEQKNCLPPTKAQGDTMLDLLIAFQHYTRRWEHKGYSDGDVHGALPETISHTLAPNVKYHKENIIGKNTPCPCGSGKKFKRCCGKDAI